jgi:hypothetical protein
LANKVGQSVSFIGQLNASSKHGTQDEVYYEQLVDKAIVFDFRKFLRLTTRYNDPDEDRAAPSDQLRADAEFSNLIYMSNWIEGESKTQQDVANLIRYMQLRSRRSSMHNNIGFVTKVCRMEKLLYIKLRLQQYKVIKEQFILDIEKGEPVLIPNELSNNSLPPSFQYYTFIQNFIDSEVRSKIQNQQMVKVTEKYNFYKHTPEGRVQLHLDGPKPLSFKHKFA